MEDFFIKSVVVVLVVILLAILVYALPREVKRESKTKEVVEEMGCEYIGTARDLNSVKFLDCNGEIKLVRVKVE